MRRMIGLVAAAAAAATIPLLPARAEYYSAEEMRGLCRGDTGEQAEFRTGAAYALLAQSYRERCRAYLLGIADGYLRGRSEGRGTQFCIPEDTSREALAELMAAALLARPAGDGTSASEVVQAVLRERFGCA